MPPRRASEILSDGHACELLEAQLAGDEAHVHSALARLDLASPICCLGLLYVADEELASVSYVYAWTQAVRDEAFAADAEEGLEALWSPPEWDVDLDDLVEPPAPLDGTAAL